MESLILGEYGWERSLRTDSLQRPPLRTEPPPFTKPWGRGLREESSVSIEHRRDPSSAPLRTVSFLQHCRHSCRDSNEEDAALPDTLLAILLACVPPSPVPAGRIAGWLARLAIIRPENYFCKRRVD